jgi:hypothetical protein
VLIFSEENNVNAVNLIIPMNLLNERRFCFPANKTQVQEDLDPDILYVFFNECPSNRVEAD